MVSFIYKFFQNLEKLFNNFHGASVVANEKKRLFLPILDLLILGGLTLPKTLIQMPTNLYYDSRCSDSYLDRDLFGTNLF